MLYYQIVTIRDDTDIITLLSELCYINRLEKVPCGECLELDAQYHFCPQSSTRNTLL